jgi:hypothetical protein
MVRRAWPYLLVLALVLGYFALLVLHPGETLYAPHSDLPDLHVPAKRFLVHATSQYGELPLWCPYELSGSPFVHDMQAAIFYPPHLLLHLLREDRVGAGLSWLVVAHVLLAGWGGIAYARWRGLGQAGATIAGVGWAFAGRWMLHLLAGGHYVVIGLAWLPWLLLAMEHALCRNAVAWTAAGGCMYALLILGTHPQWTFYASIFVALTTLGAAMWGACQSHRQAGGLPHALVRWLLVGIATAVTGIALAAVQLLPTAEAAGLATRAGGVSVSGALDGGIRSLLFLIGPALSVEPHNIEWEDRGGLTVLWLAAAITAGVIGRGRVRFDAGVALGLGVFAAGGSVLLQGLPLFHLFRQPPRMFVLVGFPVALLAGQAVDWLLRGGEQAEAVRLVGRKVLRRLLAVVAILVGGFALRSRWEGQPLRGALYWCALALTIPAAFWLLRRGVDRLTAWAWGGVLVIDLCSLTMPLVETRPEADFYPLSGWLEEVVGQPAGSGRILDRVCGDSFPLGSGAPVALVHGLEAVRGYNPLDFRHYKEYLQLVGGSDAPVRAMDGPLGFPMVTGFPVAEKQLLDLLNVRYLVQLADDPSPPGWNGPVASGSGGRVFNFLAGGLEELPPCAVYENRDALPRTFVVFDAAPLPSRPELLDALRKTDFRGVVLLEEGVATGSHAGTAPPRAATIRRYEPNHVEVAVEDGAAGWLVLGDVWYPGWRCSVDGIEVPLLRANFLFRAAAVGTGPHTVAFTFAPESYRLGKSISLVALAVLGAGITLLCVLRLRKTTPSPPTPLPQGERGEAVPSPSTPLPQGERGGRTVSAAPPRAPARSG